MNEENTIGWGAHLIDRHSQQSHVSWADGRLPRSDANRLHEQGLMLSRHFFLNLNCM